MRLRRLSSSNPDFHEVQFKPGFNLILAERTKESTKKDSRNGLGKSTFIEILYFCLGKGPTKGQVPILDDLAGWSFTLDLELFGHDIKLTRHVDTPREIVVDGSFAQWPIKPSRDEGSADYLISFNDLRAVLGHEFFGLPSNEQTQNYAPSYGSLLGYFMRRGRDAYTSPFEHHRKQAEWDKQVQVSYLLGLRWQDAAAFQELKDEKKALDQLRKAVESGVLPEFAGSEGALEAERVRLAADLEQQRRRALDFRVHEDYRSIEDDANELTEALHRLANANYSDRRAIELYRETGKDEAEQEVSREQIEAVFKEAQLHFSDSVQLELDEVGAFHTSVVANRREYLVSEIERLEREMKAREREIERLDAERASALAVLETHGALEEFVELQRQVSDKESALKAVEERIDRLREFKEARTRHSEKLRELETAARQHNDELREQRDKAILYFNANTEALYEEPGRLLIDISDSGFKFAVEIERARSEGVSSMKVFCFDLTLMQLWAEDHEKAPRFLIHDSLLYDGVDARQKALALDRAAVEADRLGWQYVCTFNSDELPTDQLPAGSPALDDPVVTLTDATDDGMLIGRRFS